MMMGTVVRYGNRDAYVIASRYLLCVIDIIAVVL